MEDNKEVYAEIKLIIEREPTVTDSDLDNADINIDAAITALDEALPELPAGAKWHVNVNE